MATEKLNVSKMSQFYISYLRFVGLWKPPKTAANAKIYTIYGLAFLFVFSFLYTFCMCMKIFFLNDVKDTTTVLFMSLNEVSLFVKVVYFYVRNRKVQALLGELNDFDLDTKEESELIADRLRFFWRLNMFYYVIANWATSTTEVSALFANETMLPFSGWYPGLDWENSSRDYWTVFLYQCAGMAITCNMSMTVDMYPCFFIYMISIEMRVLGMRMKALGYGRKATADTNGRKKTRIEADNDAIKAIIRCIRDHQNILRQSDTFERYFTMSFLSLIAISGTVICCMANELSRVS